MPEQLPLSGAILVGGRSTRMGQDKALMVVEDDLPVVSNLVATLATRCDEILLVGGDPARFEGLDLPACWVPDAQLDAGPLGGILGALEAARHDACLVVACDMPFVTVAVVCALADEPRDYTALAFPSLKGLEPLLAIYRRACLEPLRTALAGGNLQVGHFLNRVQARALPRDLATRIDPQRRVATNVNTPEDLAALRLISFSHRNGRGRG